MKSEHLQSAGIGVAVVAAVAALTLSLTGNNSSVPNGWGDKASQCWSKADSGGSRHCATGKYRRINEPNPKENK